jgi:Tat protein secretion system quality control protein TatD with DNase activity
VIVHTREADTDTVDLLRREGGGMRAACSTVSPAMRRSRARAGPRVLRLCLPIVTFPKASALRETSRSCPTIASHRDRQPVSGARPSPWIANEPARVTHVAEALASARGTTLDDLVTAADRNFGALFA